MKNRILSTNNIPLAYEDIYLESDVKEVKHLVNTIEKVYTHLEGYEYVSEREREDEEFLYDRCVDQLKLIAAKYKY